MLGYLSGCKVAVSLMIDDTQWASPIYHVHCALYYLSMITNKSKSVLNYLFCSSVSLCVYLRCGRTWMHALTESHCHDYFVFVQISVYVVTFTLACKMWPMLTCSSLSHYLWVVCVDTAYIYHKIKSCCLLNSNIDRYFYNRKSHILTVVCDLDFPD